MHFVNLNSAFGLNAAPDPQEIGAALTSLGNFTPADVVNAARPKSSLLHKYFEWDDTVAAEHYRTQQARHLILTVGIETADGPVRAMENVVIDGQHVYVPFQQVMESKEFQAQTLKRALGELEFWQAKYSRYAKLFGPVFKQIEMVKQAFKEEYEKKQKRATGRNKVRHTANTKVGRKHHDRRGHAASR